MSPAVRVEDFLAGQRDLDRAPSDDGQLGGHQLVREDVALATEAAPIRGRDHPDPAHRQLEHLAQSPVDIVRGLRRGPERELAVRGVLGDGGMLLHRQVRVAFEEDDVLPHVLGGAHRLLRVTELQRHRLVHVRRSVDRLAVSGDGLLDGHDVRQLLELHLDQVQCLVGDPFVGGGDRRDRVADVPDSLASQRLLVLAHRQDPELDREVLTNEDSVHARQRPSPGGVDVQNARVRMRAAQDPAVEHPRQCEIIGKLGLPADLGKGVGLG